MRRSTPRRPTGSSTRTCRSSAPTSTACTGAKDMDTLGRGRSADARIERHRPRDADRPPRALSRPLRDEPRDGVVHPHRHAHEQHRGHAGMIIAATHHRGRRSRRRPSRRGVGRRDEAARSPRERKAKERRARFGASAGVVLLMDAPDRSTSAHSRQYAIELRALSARRERRRLPDAESGERPLGRPRHRRRGPPCRHSDAIDVLRREGLVEGQLEGTPPASSCVRRGPRARPRSPRSGRRCARGRAFRPETWVDVVGETVDAQADEVVAALAERGWIG